jgi:hypothetical protein
VERDVRPVLPQPRDDLGRHLLDLAREPESPEVGAAPQPLDVVGDAVVPEAAVGEREVDHLVLGDQGGDLLGVVGRLEKRGRVRHLLVHSHGRAENSRGL